MRGCEAVYQKSHGREAKALAVHKTPSCHKKRTPA
jgi:hypothetical protein